MQTTGIVEPNRLSFDFRSSLAQKAAEWRLKGGMKRKEDLINEEDD